MSLFEDNLQCLRSHDPALARRVEKIALPENVVMVLARSGEPVPQVRSVCLHSRYQPVHEAKKQVSAFRPMPGVGAVVHGLGFGYHVLELLEKQEGEIVVVEPLMTLFRAFLEYVDLRPFLPRVRFLVDEPPPKILARHGTGNWNTFVHGPSTQISQAYFQMLGKCAGAEEYLATHRLKIMVVNPIYGGSLPTARFCAEALKNMGHEVDAVRCEDFADAFFAVQQTTKIKPNAEVLSSLFMNLMNEVVLARAAEFKPDLALVLAQAPLSKQGVARLKALKIPIAFWFVEDFRTLTYWNDIAEAYDYFFTIQRNEFFDALESRGIKNYYYLPQACSPAVHSPLLLDEHDSQKFSADISFMGAAYYNRLQAFPRLLEYDFKVWGTGWDLQSAVGQRVQNANERVSTDDCVKIYNGAEINLNLHSSTFHENVNPNGDFVNPRTFEIAACGAFQLVDERSELHECFRAGEEIVTFKNLEDLKNKIGFFLENPNERKTIAARARKRVLSEHTFEHRLKEMLIYIFHDSLDGLKERVNARAESVDEFIERIGSETQLGQYLKRFRNVKDFSLKTVVEPIEKGEGALTQTELLLLMVDQIAWEGDRNGE
ncbi:MAG: glycosyltransferase [Nitrospinales bacterium]